MVFPCIMKEGVYLLSDRSVTAFNLADGKLIFQYHHPKASPVMTARYGRLPRFVGWAGAGLLTSRGDGSVVAWTGKGAPEVIWRSRLKGERVTWPLIAGNGDRCVVVDSGLNTAVGIDVLRREAVWERELASACSDVVAGSSWAALVTVSEIVLVSIETGEVWFTRPLPADTYSLVSRGSWVAAVGREGHTALMEVKDKTAAVKWVKHHVEWAELTPAALSAKALVVCSYGTPRVIGLDVETGRVLWEYHDERVVHWSAPVVAGDNVVVSGGSRLVVIDEGSGKVKQTMGLDGDAGSEIERTWVPPVVIEGRYIAALRGGTVSVFLTKP